jgi:hypothetical protein
VSRLSVLQRRVAELVFGLPEASGYALAGGAALVLLRVVDRETRDLDAFVAARPGRSPGTVDELADGVVVALTDVGLSVRAVRRLPTFARFVVADGLEEVEVDLAVDIPPIRPVVLVEGIPVLDPLDLAGRKVLAIVDRVEPRDFTDLHALAALLGRDACIEAALGFDGGLTTDAISDAFARHRLRPDHEFPIDSGMVAGVRAAFDEWAASLTPDT